MSQNSGSFAPICRLVSAIGIASPLVYRVIAEGDAYQFLVLLLLAFTASVVLITNSLYTLIRYRKTEPWWMGTMFIMIGLIGIAEAWYYLPQFRM